ncbi:hypothetical protein [Ornithinibacillus halophilus]|uniref:Uncharacterized protein n=1 Tax=Ornithinibacillus halophilus TaxID=930117 RepID=A0A1M5GLK7_9BACI|nr:hypothetical protein [Ornithinibacillus halophilus]SHG04573.1 hypothetical protein SAMN05216225_101361 [Ornithinibacillus halophilus]
MNIDQEDIDNANSYIETVLLLRNDYAMFFCTKARLQAQNGQYEEAKKNVSHAIDIENPQSNDYAMRISDYRNHLSNIKTRELYANVRHDIMDAKRSIIKAETSVEQILEQTKEQADQMKTQNMQMLAFFTAIISFIIGSINIISNQPSYLESAMLMLILAGILILANLGLSILHSTIKENLSKYIIVAIIGIGLIVSGFVLYI